MGNADIRKLLGKAWGRALAAIIAVPVALTQFAIATPAIAADDTVPDPIASYSLTADANDATANQLNGEAKGVSFSADTGAAFAGGKASSAEYIKLPNELVTKFQAKNTVTISAWIKNDTSSTSTAALFFGSAAPTPAHYWLLNPATNQKTLKSVITDGTDTAKPWNTEIGASDASTADVVGKWANYTTVISANAITSYLDGAQVATAKRTLSLADFGTNLEAYIGRSNYTADKTWGGNVQDVRFYDSALTAAQVNEVSADATTPATKQAVARRVADAIDLGDLSMVAGNLKLPAIGAHGATIVWQSSEPDIIAADGTVTPGTKDATVTLTATVTVAGQTAIREFTVTVPGNTTDPVEALRGLSLPYVLTAGTMLPAKSGAVALTWDSSDETLVNDGTVVGNADGKGLADVNLTATGAYEGTTAKQTFHVKIAEKHAVLGTSYTLPGSNLSRRASMHLALSDDGTAYEPLNLNEGVLYAAADFTGANALNGRGKWMSNPYVFRMKDGTFGVVANQTDARSNGNTEDPDPAAKGKVLFFTSDDLIAYRQVGFVTLDPDGNDVFAPTAQYDSVAETYRLTWKDEGGATYQASTKDFVTVGAAVRTTASDEGKPDVGVADALVGNGFALTQSEAKRLRARFLQATNTAVEGAGTPIEKTMTVGDKAPSAADLGTVTATYSDGVTNELPVIWDAADLAKVDTSREGTYTVRGTIEAKDFDFPFFTEETDDKKSDVGSPDPETFVYNGKYYFVSTTGDSVGGEHNGQKRLYMRGPSDTIEGLQSAKVTKITPDSEDEMLAWAPEIHEINGTTYLYYSYGDIWQNMNSYIVPLKAGGDPTSPTDWLWSQRTPVRRDPDKLLDPIGNTIDMTVFEDNGTWYAMWSDRVVYTDETRTVEKAGTADLKIATFDPENPAQLTSDPVIVARPDAGWERYAEYPIVEGPYALHHDGKVVVTYSGAATKPCYAVGELTAKEGSNLLDPASWRKDNAPILTSTNIDGQWGPGHNSYFIGLDGKLYTSIHARKSPQTKGGERYATIRAVRWGSEGNMVLDMTAAREADSSLRDVSVTVTVKKAETPAADLSLRVEKTASNNQVLSQTVTDIKDGTDAGAKRLDLVLDYWTPDGGTTGVKTDKSKLQLKFATNAGAKVTMNDGSAIPATQDLTKPFKVKVTSADGKSSQLYEVTAQVLVTPIRIPGEKAPTGETGLMFFADPQVVSWGGKYYIFPTTDGYSGWSGYQIHAFESSDMVNWEDRGVVVDLKDQNLDGKPDSDILPKRTSTAWAPAFAERDGKFYLYFSGNEGVKGTNQTNVAISDTAKGGTITSGYVLQGDAGANKDGKVASNIDPGAFVDPADGSYWLTWGQSGDRGAYAQLNDDMKTIGAKHQVGRTAAQGLNEGQYLTARKDPADKTGKTWIYYFTYSKHDTNDPRYCVGYATAKGESLAKVTGWTYGGEILNQDAAKGILGTGHHSLLQVPNTDDWYIVYHAFLTDEMRPRGVDANTGEQIRTGNKREVRIARLTYGADGSIERVPVTYEGVLPETTPAVSVAGVAADGAKNAVGDKLSVAYNEGWKLASVQWYRADDASGDHEVAIEGATSAEYTLAAADAGKVVYAKTVGENTTGVLQNAQPGTAGAKASRTFEMTSAKATVAEAPAVVPVESVVVSVDRAELTVGETAQASAVVAPEDATDKTVAWASSDDAVATVDASGKVTAVAPGTVEITATAGGVSGKVSVTVKAAVPECRPLTFSDVSAATPHKADIDWLACKGISTGWSTGENTAVFSPMGLVIRQDMAAFLYRLAGSPDYTPSDEDKARFTDVDESTPHYKEVLWLASTGIAEGFRNVDGTFSFGGNRVVVRQDMAAFLKRLADYRKADPVLGEGVNFTDVDGTAPHFEEIQWLARTGVAGGFPDGSFGGMRLVVRQDMAAFLHRMDTNVLTK